MKDEDMVSRKPEVVGIPFKKDELVILIRTINMEMDFFEIRFDTSKKLIEYEDRKNHPAFSEYYKELILKKLVWDGYKKQIDPLISKLENSLLQFN